MSHVDIIYLACSSGGLKYAIIGSSIYTSCKFIEDSDSITFVHTKMH